MVEGKRVAVVVPAYQEELLVADTIRGIPAFVDAIVVVDDRSGDATVERARATGDPRVDVIEHEENTGVGGAIVTGYRRCRELGIVMTVVGFLLGVVVAASRIVWGNEITTATIVLVALLLVSGTQFTLFAMWFDQEANKELR